MSLSPRTITVSLAAVFACALWLVAVHPAFAATIVGSRIQAESMTITGSNVNSNNETTDDGTHMRFTGTAGTSDKLSFTTTPSQCVDQIQIRARESGSGLGDDKLGVWIDGTASGNKVGEVLPPAGSTWATLTLDFTPAMSSGVSHTVYVGPAQTNDNFVALDWVELWHNTCATGGDTTAPDTSIASGPAEGATLNTGNLSFTYNSTEANSTFQCSLVAQGNAANYSSCPSTGQSYNVADGSYTFSVKATDQATNTDATPATRNFTVASAGDSQAPDTTLTNISSPTNTRYPTFSFSGSDNVGVDHFECQVDSGAWEPCFSPNQLDTALSDGSHTFSVRAYDAAGNVDASPASQTFTVDATPPGAPSFTSLSPPDGATDSDGSFDYSWTGAETGGTYECSLVSYGAAASFSACSSPKSYIGKSDGLYQFSVRQVDAANNTGEAASRLISVSTGGGGQAFSTKVQAEDFAKQSSSITTVDGTNDEGLHLEWLAGATTSQTASTSQNFGGPVTTIDLRGQGVNSTEDLAVYLDGTGTGNIIGTASNWGSTFSTRTINVNVPSGQHTIYFGPPATFGSTEKMRLDWVQFNGTAGSGGTTDNTDPDTTINPIDSPTNDNRPTFTFGGSDNVGVSGFSCRVDGTNWQGCVSPYTTALLADGTHVFEARAQDAAGNVDQSPASQTFTVDTQAPSAPQITGGPANASTDNDGDFTYSFTGESGANFECSLDAGTPNFQSCSSPKDYLNRPDGNWTFRVRQTDAAGNTSPETSRTVTVATTIPSQQLPYKVQFEDTNWSDPSIYVGDAAADEGTHLVWDSGAPTSALASTTVNFGQAAGNLTLNGKMLSGSEQLAVYLDGTTSADKIATKSGMPTSFSTFTVPVSVPSGTHTIYFGPNVALGSTQRMRLDYVNFEASGTPSDTSDPTTTLTNVQSPTNDNTPTFSFNGSDTGGSGLNHFNCTIDTTNVAPCTSPYTTSALADGSHTFGVTAYDGAGNYDHTAATQTFTVDTQAPSAPSITSPSSDGTTDTDGNLSFSFNGESSATFQCSLELSGSPDQFSSCSSPRSYSGKANGDYTFKVKQTDQAGNVSSAASRTITVNTGSGGGGGTTDVPISGLGTMSTSNNNSVALNDSGGAITQANCDHRIARGTTTGTTVSGSGTSSNPWVGRDAWKNLEAAASGGNILCVDGPNGFSGNGIYDVNGPVTGNGIYDAGEYEMKLSASGTSSNRTYLISTPGTGRAELVGSLNVSGSYVSVFNLKVDGTGGDSSATRSNQSRWNTGNAVGLMGSNDQLVNTEVYYKGQTDGSEDAIPEAPDLGVCVKVGGSASAPNAVVLGNWIHNCGAPHWLYDAGSDGSWTGSDDNHAVYWDNADNGLFTQNLVHDAAEQGMNLYNETDGSLVTNNIIVRQGKTNVRFQSPSGSVNDVTHNILAYSQDDKNITEVSGSGTVSDNCVFSFPQFGSSTGIKEVSGGATFANNILADPGFAHVPANTLAGQMDNSDDYTMSGSTCKGKLTVTQTKSPNR